MIIFVCKFLLPAVQMVAKDVAMSGIGVDFKRVFQRNVRKRWGFVVVVMIAVGWAGWRVMEQGTRGGAKLACRTPEFA